MRIEVGKTYSTRMSARVQIVMKTTMFDDGHDMFRPFLGSNGKRYDSNGNINHFRTDGQSLDDLIAEVPAQMSSAEAIGTVVLNVASRFSSLLGR